MSHEQLKQKEEYDKMMTIANAHKKRVRNQLAEITIEYNKLIRLLVHFVLLKLLTFDSNKNFY